MKIGSFVSPGQLIGPFEVTTLVSRGDRFDVFIASHDEFGLWIALKILHRAYVQDVSMVKQLHYHMVVLEKLIHPNVVTTYKVGLTPDGQPYAAMNFVEGETLEAAITILGRQGSPISINYALTVSRGIAIGLGALHDLNMVHYALSPQHVLIREDGTPVLIGLTPPVSADSDAVEGGPGVGRFDYRAPETVAEKVIDERSNIYSLGVMLYAILTADQSAEPAAAEKTWQILPLNEMREDLSAESCLVVDRCLNTHASDRFQTMGEVITAIDLAIISEDQRGRIAYIFDLALIRLRDHSQSLFLLLIALVVILGIGMAVRLFGPKTKVARIGPESAVAGSLTAKPVVSMATPTEDNSIIEVLSPADNASYEIDERLSFSWCWPKPLRPEEEFILHLESDSQEENFDFDPEIIVDKCYEFAVFGLDVVEFPGSYRWQIRIHNTISDTLLNESEFRGIEILADSSWSSRTHTPSPTASSTSLPTESATATSTATILPSATATRRPILTPLPPTFTPTATPLPPTIAPPRPTSPPTALPPPTPTAPLPPPPTPTAPLSPQQRSTVSLHNRYLTLTQEVAGGTYV